ncbi:hypothetical protein NC651_029290 [Populus alba x Populus x berolinensis]|nr:hypothetical protein NC651_029290 [Populus alba x Populus x berolinensis]
MQSFRICSRFVASTTELFCSSISISSFLNRSPFHPSHRSFTNVRPVIFSSDSAAPGPSYWISMDAIFVDEAASSSNKDVLGFKDNVVSSLNLK